jgi:hypothetical protein
MVYKSIIVRFIAENRLTETRVKKWNCILRLYAREKYYSPKQ